jgi:hypothetical protein
MAMKAQQQPAPTEATPAPGQEAGSSPEEQAQKNELYKSAMAKYHTDSFENLNKAIKTNHDAINKQILAQHKEINKKQLKEFKEHSKKTLAKIKSSLISDKPKK